MIFISGFPFLDEDMPHSIPMVYIYVAVCLMLYSTFNVNAFGKKLVLMAKLIKQGYQYHKLQLKLKLVISHCVIHNTICKLVK